MGHPATLDQRRPFQKVSRSATHDFSRGQAPLGLGAVGVCGRTL